MEGSAFIRAALRILGGIFLACAGFLGYAVISPHDYGQWFQPLFDHLAKTLVVLLVLLGLFLFVLGGRKAP